MFVPVLAAQYTDHEWVTKKSNHQSRNSFSRSLVFPLTMSDRIQARVYFQVCDVWHHASSVFTLNHARTEYFWKWKKKYVQTNVHIHKNFAKMRVRETRSTRWISLSKFFYYWTFSARNLNENRNVVQIDYFVMKPNKL